MLCLTNIFGEPNYYILEKFGKADVNNQNNGCKTNDVNTEDIGEAFEDELNAIVENKGS